MTLENKKNDVLWLVEDLGDIFFSFVKKKKRIYEIGYYDCILGRDSYKSLAQIDGKCIYHGSLGILNFLKNINLNPGPIASLDKFRCSFYYPRLGDKLLNSDHIILTMDEFLTQKEMIFDSFSKDGYVFIRPDSGFKIFTGTKINEEDISQGNVSRFSFDTDLILVTSPKNIFREWRLVVSEEQIVAGCQYINSSGEIDFDTNIPKSVTNYIQHEIKGSWSPDLIYVMDVVECEGDDIKILELNSFSCSDFYECNPAVIVDFVENLIGNLIGNGNDAI